MTAEGGAGFQKPCDVCRLINPVGRLEAAVARPESRELVGAACDDRNAAGFQNLKCLRNVQQRLRTGADDENRRAAEFIQIGGDIEAFLCALVDPADAAGCKDANASRIGGCPTFSHR